MYDDWMDADIFEDFDIDFVEDASTGIMVSGALSEVCCAVWSIHAMTTHPSDTVFSVVFCVPCSSLAWARNQNVLTQASIETALWLSGKLMSGAV